MKIEHYPSLELCRNLTEAGFPETEKFMDYKWNIYSEWEIYHISVCPSIAELLDELPQYIDKHCLTINAVGDGRSDVEYFNFNDEDLMVTFCWTLTNALAEMWLWLIENSYLK